MNHCTSFEATHEHRCTGVLSYERSFSPLTLRGKVAVVCTVYCRETDRAGRSGGVLGVDKEVTISVTSVKGKQQAIASKLLDGEHLRDRVVGC